VPTPCCAQNELSRLIANRYLEILPEELDAVLSWARPTGYQLVSLKELCELLRNRNGRQEQRMFCVTFDDGYKDNLTHALPVLEKHKCPATVFVTTNMPDLRQQLWWYALETVLKDEKDRDREFGELSAKFRLGDEREAQELYRSFNWTKETFEGLCRRLALSWDDVRALAQHTLITIGAHTVSHPSLSKLSDAELFKELRESKTRLEQETGREVTLFAYPFGGCGACGAREFEAAKSAGYEAAVTTREGNVVREHQDHLRALPRHYVGEGGNLSLSALESQVSGYQFLRRGQFHPVVVH